MGILSTLLSDAAYGTRLGSVDAGPRPGHDGHFMMALNIAAFTDILSFKAEMDTLIAEQHNCRRAPGVDRIYSPGELEQECAKNYHQQGIPLNDETLEDIAGTARNLGVEISEYLP